MCVPLYYFERYAHTYASGVPKMVMTEKIFCCHVQLCQCRWCRQSLYNGLLQNCLHSALMPYNTLNISVKSSVDRGEFCLHCHLHSCLCRGRHIICASQKKMCREVEKSVALTENPLPLCRNVRVARLFCREACAVWWQCRWVQMGVGVVQKLLGLVCTAQSADNQSYFVQKCRVQTKWLKTELGANMSFLPL